MKKAILKTLVYADIFDYPLNVFEIHKWLIGRKATLRQVAKALDKLREKREAERVKDYYVLPKRASLVGKRRSREKQSAIYLRKAKLLTAILKAIPWIKLVGVSGGLAMDNADKTDDIDLFIITSKNRLWISRLLALGLLTLTGQRRKVGDKGKKIAGKICLNILLEEDRLDQKNKDIYLAHEVLQMKVLWQRDGVYSKYLMDNEWAFKFLPNWVGDARGPASSVSVPLRGAPTSSLTSFAAVMRLDPSSLSPLAGILENLARQFQLWYMKQPKGMERIEDGALYFHPNDIRPQVLSEYNRKIKHIFGTP